MYLLDWINSYWNNLIRKRKLTYIELVFKFCIYFHFHFHFQLLSFNTFVTSNCIHPWCCGKKKENSLFPRYSLSPDGHLSDISLKFFHVAFTYLQKIFTKKYNLSIVSSKRCFHMYFYDEYNFHYYSFCSDVNTTVAF